MVRRSQPEKLRHYRSWRKITAATQATAEARAAVPFDHSAFYKLLRKHVNAQGLVSYTGFRADEAAFNQYLAQLSKNRPTGSWPRN